MLSVRCAGCQRHECEEKVGGLQGHMKSNQTSYTEGRKPRSGPRKEGTAKNERFPQQRPRLQSWCTCEDACDQGKKDMFIDRCPGRVRAGLNRRIVATCIKNGIPTRVNHLAGSVTVPEPTQLVRRIVGRCHSRLLGRRHHPQNEQRRMVSEPRGHCNSPGGTICRVAFLPPIGTPTTVKETKLSDVFQLRLQMFSMDCERSTRGAVWAISTGCRS